jgi:hypothetical protein
LDLGTGPLLRLALLDGPGGLLVVLHDLAADGPSWRLLLEDLRTAYLRLEAGAAPRLVSPTTSARTWARRLAACAAAGWPTDGLEAWPADLPTAPAAPATPGGCATPEAVAVTLEPEPTRALLAAGGGADPADLLFAALAHALGDWARWDGAVELRGHGRPALWEDMDLGRTVGCLTPRFPIRLAPPWPVGPTEALRTAQDLLGRIPHRGAGYGLRRPRGGPVAAAPATVSLDYLGSWDGVLAEPGPWGWPEEGGGLWRGLAPAGGRLLEVHALVAGRRLRAWWSYDARALGRAEVERLAHAWVGSLARLAGGAPDAAATPEAPFDWTGSDLDLIVAAIQRSQGED